MDSGFPGASCLCRISYIMSKKLSPAELDQLIQVLRSNRVIYALIFGSAARGEMGFESDVDIAISGDHALSSDEKYTLISSLAAVVRRPIDLVDLRTARGVLSVRALQGEELFCDSLRVKGEILFRRLSLVEEDLGYAKRSFDLAQQKMFR